MRKRQIILHIGTMKTGTTSIQQVFGKHRAEIMAQGAFYPATPGQRAHELLTYTAAGGTKGPRKGDAFWKGADPVERMALFRQEFDAEIRGLPEEIDRVIISDERMSFFLRTREHIAALKDVLEPYASSFRVIVYLRSQDSFLASRYSEQLRVGGVGEPDHRRDQPERLQDYNYQWLLDNWASVFGEAAVTPRIYERSAGKSFDSVKDFFVACGLTPVEEAAQKEVLRNPSMNAEGQLVLREVGRLMQAQLGRQAVGGALWRRISDAVTAALPGKGWLPTKSEATEFMTRFAAINEDVRRRFFPERETLFADETGTNPDEPMLISAEVQFAAACKALLEVATHAQRREQAAERGAEKGEGRQASKGEGRAEAREEKRAAARQRKKEKV